MSEESQDGWARFAVEHGCSITAAIEAFGLVLGEPGGVSQRLTGEVVALARGIDAERRSRRSRP